MARFQLAPTCRSLYAPLALYAVGTAVAVADPIGITARPPDLLQMNEIASVRGVVREDRDESATVQWILETLTAATTSATGVTMIDDRFENETIPTLHANNHCELTSVHRLNLELDLRAIPCHRLRRVNDRP